MLASRNQNKPAMFKAWALAQVLIALGANSADAREGGFTGGGGQGVLCIEDGRKTLLSLDTYEGRHIWDYNYPESGDLAAEYARVAPRYKEFHFSAGSFYPYDNYNTAQMTEVVRKNFEGFERQLKDIHKGSRIPPSNDQGKFLIELPPNCSRVQVLYYIDTPASSTGDVKILKDPEYWALLDAQEKIAFHFHEQFFANFRRQGDQDSIDARKLTALMVSSEPFPGVYSWVKRAKTGLICHSKSYFFAAYEDPANGFEEMFPKGSVKATIAFMRKAGVNPRVETLMTTMFPIEAWSQPELRSAGGMISYTTSVLGAKQDRTFLSLVSSEIGIPGATEEEGNKMEKFECEPLEKWLQGRHFILP